MTVSIETSPAFLQTGKPARVTLTASDGNRVRISVSAAPLGSALRSELDDTRQTRITIAVADSGVPFDLPFAKFGKAGRYHLILEELNQRSGHRGGYHGWVPPDPAADDEILGTFTDELYVAQRVRIPVGTSTDRATLVLYVDEDDRIATTSVPSQGEASPALVAETPTPGIALALESTAVKAAVAALAGHIVTDAIGDISTIVSDIVTNHNGHTGVGGIHYTADATNLIPVSYGSAMAPKNLPDFVNVALKAMRQHRTNDDGTGVDAARYHDPTTSLKVSDFAYVPIIDSVGGLAEAYAALAELWRCHEGHRPMPSDFHGPPTGPTSLFALAALPLLLQVHLRVFEVLASFEPTVPDTQSAGTSALINMCGAEESAQ